MKDVHILLVEDNEGDIILTREALKDANIRNEVSVAMDGEQALRMLHEAVELPDLILLDINLPRLSGLEVLASIKSDERLKEIPVIMLTTSSAEKDILTSYAHHANRFITKPVDLPRFLEVIKTIEDFLITIIKDPKQKRA
jgi:two-component system, chemotaxis family, response regulator Rcp1